MRLWSLHPKHLDAKGLVTLWREGLLARAVLKGNTKGYRHHPQLERFRRSKDPVAAIDCYLHHVLDEACARGYRFDETKIGQKISMRCQSVHHGQLTHEWQHFLRKLYKRDRRHWYALRLESPLCHPFFRLAPGAIEVWERL